jgi:farnesol dehydrogenase
MERLAKRYSARGLHVVIVNPTRVYGPGPLGESNTAVEIIMKYLQGNWKLIPASDRIGSYVFIDDVVDGHILAMENGRSGERYILGGDNRKFSDLFLVTRILTGVNWKLYKVPLNLVLMISLAETTIANILKRKPRLPFDWSSKLIYNWAVSGEKTKRELGYKITPLEEGLKKTILWLIENQKVEIHPGLVSKRIHEIKSREPEGKSFTGFPDQEFYHAEKGQERKID